MNFPRASLTQLRAAILTASLFACIPFISHVQKVFSSEASGTANILSVSTPTPSPSPGASSDKIVLDVSPDIDPTRHTQELKISSMFDQAFGTEDVDCDGIKNSVDNCPIAFNPGQADKNGDGAGDVCDPKSGGTPDIVDFRCDRDGDGLLDRNDNCIFVCNPDQKDKNKNGVGDACDPLLKPNFKRIDPCPKKSRKTRCD